MTVVCDMGPLHYLILIGCDHVLPSLFDRILTATVIVEKEMSDPTTPKFVRRWAANPPRWLEVRAPQHLTDIPSLGKSGLRGDGDRAVIALALEEHADYLLMDDTKARKEAKKRGIESLWMLEVLDEAAERGLINDLPERLEALQHRTRFYVGDKVRHVFEAMKQRDLQRKLAQQQDSKPDKEVDQKPDIAKGQN
jgi:uncharacterized protein